MNGQAHEPAILLESSTPERTGAIAAAVARVAQPGDLIGLIGELGAGKTQFVRGLAEGLGIDPDHVSSPTFVLMQEYEPADADRPVLVHIDAYRLHGPADVASIGWDAGAEELRQNAVVALEWAERVRESLGEHWLEVVIEHADEGRRITLHPHGNWAAKMDALTAFLRGIR